MLSHSIIIPHRDYSKYLEMCLWSIRCSAHCCDVDDYEVLVVDQGSKLPPTLYDPHDRLIKQPRAPAYRYIRYFNKPMALNEGIRQAKGEILTFLDADAIVGELWMDCVSWLKGENDRNAMTKLCYRVRYLPETALIRMAALEPDAREKMVYGERGFFDCYRDFQRAVECYGEPDKDPHNNPPGRKWDGDEPPEHPIFGNSQFSIHRDQLGKIRFDEKYVGRGFEDIAMNREIWRRKGDNYRAGIVLDSRHAMFHVRNPSQGEKWGAGKQNTANLRRYNKT